MCVCHVCAFSCTFIIIVIFNVTPASNVACTSYEAANVLGSTGNIRSWISYSLHHHVSVVSYPDPNVRNDDYRLQYNIRTFGSGYETNVSVCCYKYTPR